MTRCPSGHTGPFTLAYEETHFHAHAHVSRYGVLVVSSKSDIGDSTGYRLMCDTEGCPTSEPFEISGDNVDHIKWDYSWGWW
jgi:hypothetical protein